MECKIVKLGKYCGSKASVYSVFMNNEGLTSFEKFINENKELFISEIKDLSGRLKTIGTKTGVRETFIKKEEGVPGDGVCALYDKPKAKLRLYCISYGLQIIIIGGGGRKNVRALQDDEKLKKENYLLRELSQQITKRIKEKEIVYVSDGLDFEGNFEFTINETEIYR